MNQTMKILFLVVGLLATGWFSWAKPIQPPQSLHHAASQGDISALKHLLKMGLDINQRDADGRIAAMVALENRQYKTADWLISRGSSLTIKDKNGRSLLYYAIANGGKAVSFRLILGGFDPNDRDNRNVSMLNLAALQGWADGVQLLLDKGARINPAESPTHSAAYQAGKRGYIKIVRRLSRHQPADPFLLAFFAPLQVVQRACAPAVRITDLSIPSTGETPLHLACYGNNQRFVSQWLKSGNPSGTPDHQGRTALHIAAMLGHKTLVRQLLQFGANVNTRDIHGQTALDVAKKQKQLTIIRILTRAQSSK